ncbi:MAG: DUF4231 domain-containing protein, partial [Actinomycetota bacterium]
MIVHAAPDSDPDDVLRHLGIGSDGRPTIVVVGGAGTLDARQLEVVSRLVGPAVARAASAVGAAVVDGGTDAGVMRVVGDAATHIGQPRFPLVGIAPAPLVAQGGAHGSGEEVPLEPHHTHFVLVETGRWGGETGLLTRIAASIARESPVAVVAAGGGKVTRRELLEATRMGWPIFPVVGAGGTPEWIASHPVAEGAPRRGTGAAGRRRRRRPASGADDPETREILRAGDVRPIASDDALDLERRLTWELRGPPELKEAWLAFARYDALAGRLRRTFEQLQLSILGVGLFATGMAVLKVSLESFVRSPWTDSVLRYVIVAAPIALSVVIAFAHRVAAGKRWVVLRAAAEGIKQEIYRFRTGTGLYARTAPGAGSEQVLVERLNDIESRLIQTEAGSGVLPEYAGPLPPTMFGGAGGDDGLTSLTADRYLKVRVDDQLTYFRHKVARLVRRRDYFTLLALASGGIGALLAAAGLEIWVALTTALGAAAISHLSYLQVENTIVTYNQAASRLESLARGWRALPPAQRGRAAFERLVTDVELVL